MEFLDLYKMELTYVPYENVSARNLRILRD